MDGKPNSQKSSQLLHPQQAHTLPAPSPRTSFQTLDREDAERPPMLTTARSNSSQLTIQFDDSVRRMPSVTHLPEAEKQEYAPCRDAHRPKISRWYGNVRWQAVLAVAAGFCQQALSWGFIMIYGSQFTYFEDVLMPGRSRVELSLPGALAPCLLLMFSGVVGRLCDAHYHLWINVVGSIFLIAGFFCLTFGPGSGEPGTGNYGIVVLAYVLQGLGQSSFFVTSSHIASSWYPEKPALPIGITSCGVAIAGIVWPVMFQEGASEWGFRNAVGGMTGLVILLCIFVCFFGNPNPEQHHRRLGKVMSLHTWVDPAALRSPSWIFGAASTCLIYLALLVIPQFMEDWAVVRKLTLDLDQAVILLTVAMASSLVGRLGGSFIAGKLGFRLTHAVFNFAQMILIFCFWMLAKNWSHAVAFAVITGIFIGAIITLPPGGMKEIVAGSAATPSRAAPEIAYIGDKRPSQAPTAVPSRTQSNSSSSTDIQHVDSDATVGPTHHAREVAAIASQAGLTPSDHKKTRLGQWLGMSFLCAAPFVLTGNLATSRLVQQYGIQAAGWWAGTCYGGAGVCLCLSLLMSRLEKKKAEAHAGQSVV